MAIKISRRTVLVGAIVAWPILSRAIGMDPSPAVDASAIVSSIPENVPAEARAPVHASAPLALPPKPAVASQADAESAIDMIGHRIVEALRSLVQ